MARKDGYINSYKTRREFVFLTKFLEQNQYLRDKKFSVKDTSVTYRTINYWDSVGLLEDDRQNQETGWRKFSKTDMAFIAIITKLRNAGFSIEKIKNTKRFLMGYLNFGFQESRDGATNAVMYDFKCPMTMLEFGYYRALALQNGGNTYLVVEDDGAAMVMSELDLELNRDVDEMPDSYYLINLNALFHSYFGERFKIWENNSRYVSSDEFAVLNELRSYEADADTITIRRNGKKITLIERQESHMPDGELHKLINKIGYGKVSAEIKNGKICVIQTTENIKP